MNTYNVVISVTTTVCIDAKSADDAIEKVSQALNNGKQEPLSLLSRLPFVGRRAFCLCE